MNSKAASTFWKSYEKLPVEIRRLALKNFRLWLANPRHPSLHFKPFWEKFWSARVGDHYRVVGYHRDPNTFVWTWIGTHEEYNKF
ncbi:MAG: hypothetical protein WBN75_03640 [Verrucomicrobiia bacterium]|jgi:mRNA-degrading endonuclease RelE of RelBE toxin-antitoxin system